ncbi:Membrane bound O-acyl transferase, MBOAT family-containing protein [Strongyloides ratti]|uniref:Membrane bound O-acyl transferase, MBOAT family-containing protein n=1 Tax=Strongyloides ratti TaxID=34506 RepID=A0A090LL81_STRRB|nr:Membrane bound O-acyl transferase, MBOAT family-containing protein [Strongyloides ratti]CEF68933.1 Membrane bound O-acyl transferase, MBOAT family-containing protein [Strongyloides ratti]
MEATFYDGCKIFLPLSKLFGFDVNFINFVLSLLVSFGLAKFFVKYLTILDVSVNIRSLYTGGCGILICYFMYGKGIIHPIIMSFLNYCIMAYFPKELTIKLCFIISLSHLLIIHLIRYIYVDIYTIDITSVLMIMVQKCCLISLALANGRDEKLANNKENSLKSISEIPDILMYIAYMFNFQTFLTGPSFEFVDFKNFIEGKHYIERKEKKSNVENIIRDKIIYGNMFLIIYLIFKDYSCDNVLAQHIIQLPWYLWIISCQMGTTILRGRYYFAWYISDAICNISGFGFNGYDENDEEKWDLCTNVNVKKVELSYSLKECIDNWNIGTCKWLRLTVYERLPESSRTMGTFVLSAIWHGFHPGYYVTFTIAALFTNASRIFRKYFRYHFTSSNDKKQMYDIFTFVVTRLAIIYGAIPFALETFYKSTVFLKQFYFCGHFIALAVIFIVPNIFEKPSFSENHTIKKNKSSCNNNKNDEVFVDKTQESIKSDCKKLN